MGVFMNLDIKINENYNKLNKNDLYVLQFVKSNIDLCSNLNISELSSKCNISTASILRTTKKLNFSGYSEFKYFLKHENTEPLQLRDKDAISRTNLDIQQTIKIFQQSNIREKIYELIYNCDTFYAYGTGHGQNLVLQEFSRCLLNINKNLIVLPAYTELHLAMNNFKKGDLLLVVSLSGNLKELRETLLSLEMRGIDTFSITNFVNNELASFTEYNFYFHSSSIIKETNLNKSSFLTLHLLLHLIFEEYSYYVQKLELLKSNDE